MSENIPQTTTDRVIDIVADKSGHERKTVLPTSDLSNDLHFDSLDAVELCMEVEKEWNLAFSDDEMEKLSNVQSIVDLVEKKLAEQKAATAPATEK